jgi:site-specific recombinase XerD
VRLIPLWVKRILIKQINAAIEAEGYSSHTTTGKRNRAILAILLGGGLRRRECAELT